MKKIYFQSRKIIIIGVSILVISVFEMWFFQSVILKVFSGIMIVISLMIILIVLFSFHRVELTGKELIIIYNPIKRPVILKWEEINYVIYDSINSEISMIHVSSDKNLKIRKTIFWIKDSESLLEDLEFYAVNAKVIK